MNGNASSGRAIRRTNMWNLFPSVTSAVTCPGQSQDNPCLATVVRSDDHRSACHRLRRGGGIPLFSRKRDDAGVTRGGLELAPARSTRRACWLSAVALVGAGLFAVGLLVELRCARGRCPSARVHRLFDLDGIGSLPRLFTTAVFLAIAVLALVACRRAQDRARLWWGALVVGGAALAVAKAVSVHSSLERDDGQQTTLVVGVTLTVVGLPLLWWAGRRWVVPGATLATAALGLYALAALGLDQVTGAVVSARPVVRALAVFVEEGGEAFTAVVLLAAVSVAGARRPWGTGQS